jgi:hypothetical protein
MSQAYVGNYSTNNFNAAKRYLMQFAKNTQVADVDLLNIQDVSESFLRQLISANFPTGSSINNGFKVVQSSSTSNNFTIKGGDGTVDGAGVLFVDGYILFLKSDIEYNQQNDSGVLTDDDYTKSTIPALTTPGADRIDEVYVDFYFAEVAADGSEYTDTSLIVSGIGNKTANRMRQVQDILVAEGGVTPTDGNDGNGIYHRYVKIATLKRKAGMANIVNDDTSKSFIIDNRKLIDSADEVNNKINFLWKNGNLPTLPGTQYWNDICYGNGTFVAVATNYIAYSPDGLNWTVCLNFYGFWASVCYGNGIFVVVGVNSNYYSPNIYSVLTSSDGKIWTARNLTSEDSINWRKVVYGNNKFVAIADAYGNTTKIMTSVDGINWTLQTVPDLYYWDIHFANGLFVIGVLLEQYVLTSSDGLTWTQKSLPVTVTYGVTNICYGNGKYLLIDAINLKIFSTVDFITYTNSDAPSDNWTSICYGDGKFVAIADKVTGLKFRYITSDDGISWNDFYIDDMDRHGFTRVHYVDDMFITVCSDASCTTSIYSGSLKTIETPHNNLYQGGMLINGNVGIGTLTPVTTLVVQGDATISGLTVSQIVETNASKKLISAAKQTGYNLALGTIAGTVSEGNHAHTNMVTGVGTTNYVTKYTNGTGGIGNSLILDNGTNVGIGTATPNAKLHVQGDMLISNNLTVNGTTTTINTATTSTDKLVISQADNDNALTISQTNGSASSTVVTISNSGTGYALTTGAGNVGIGTATPLAKLQVEGNLFLSNGSNIGDDTHRVGSIFMASNIDYKTNDLMFKNNGTETVRFTTGGNVGIGSTQPTKALVISDGTVNLMLDHTASGAEVGTSSNHHLRFITNATERMIVTNSGNVGIGDNPSFLSTDIKCKIKGSKFVLDGGGAGSSRMMLVISDNAAMAQGNGGGIGFCGYATGTYEIPYASLNGYKANATDGDYSGQLHFQTIYNNSALTTKMVIDEFGRVGIGTLTPTQTLDVNGAASFNGAVSLAGNLVFKNPGTYTYIYGNNTVDGADTKGLIIASTSDNSQARGAFLQMFGNEATSYNGQYHMFCGIGTTGTPGYFTMSGNIKLGLGPTADYSSISYTGAQNKGLSFDNNNFPYFTGSPYGSGSSRANLILRDDTSFQQGVGGGVAFFGKYNSAGNYTDFGCIKAVKLNGTDGDTSARLEIAANQATRISITGNNGYVGINSNLPTQQLDINGNIALTGQTYSYIYSNATITYLQPNTADGSDNKSIMISGGGAFATARGAGIFLTGNEYTGYKPGILTLAAGAGTTAIPGRIELYDNSNLAVVANTISYDGLNGSGITFDTNKSVTITNTANVPLFVYNKTSNTDAYVIVVYSDVGSAANITASIRANGQIRSDAGTTISSPADFAEWTKVEGDLALYEVGTIVQQSTISNTITIAEDYEKVYGVVTDRATFCGGLTECFSNELIKKDFMNLSTNELETKYNAKRIAMTGHIQCKVVGKVNIGDRLFLSTSSGVAKSAKSFEEKVFSFGIARESYSSSTVGLIEIRLL